MNWTRIADTFRSRLVIPCVALATTLVVSLPAAQATTLEIQFSGLDLVYDGNNIFDSGVQNTVRTGNPADGDSLTLMEFFLDGTLVHTLNSDIFADIYIANVGAMPAAGGLLTSAGNGNGFGIDLLTENNNPGWGLALNIDTMEMFYTGSNIAITVAGTASSIGVQQLPLGLEFDPSQPLTIVLSSANLTNVTTSGGFVTNMDAAGTGNVAGTQVPEPGSVALLALGLAGLVAFGWRRRKAC